MKILNIDSELKKEMDTIANAEKERLFAEQFGVSPSKSIYLSSEGRSFVELHTIASELNLSSYARKRDLIFKVGESE